MHLDDAVSYLIDFTRNPRRQDAYSTFGYEFKLEIVIRSYLQELEDWPPHIQYVQDHPRVRENLTNFL